MANDPNFVQGLISKINEAVRFAFEQPGGHTRSLFSVVHGLRQLPNLADAEEEVLSALQYRLLLPGDDGREEHGVFGPMTELQGESGDLVRYPVSLGEVPDEILFLWKALAAEESLLHPWMKARFADLLFVGRFGSDYYQHAQPAIDDYLAAAKELGANRESKTLLLRALDLCLSLNKPPELVLDAIDELLVDSLGSSDKAVGIEVPLLQALSVHRRERALELIALGFSKYEDPWAEEELIEVKASVVSPEDRPPLFERQVDIYVELAALTENSVQKLGFLYKAAEIAQRRDLPERAAALQVQVEHLALEMPTRAFEYSLPEDVVRSLIDEIVGDDSFPDFLTRFGMYDCNGTLEHNVRHVEELRQAAPLTYMFKRVQIGGFNEIAAQTSEDQIEDAALGETSQRKLRMFGFAYGRAMFDEAIAKYEPTPEDLTELFTSAALKQDIASKVARAVGLHRQGDDDSACHVLAPRIEAAIRHMAHTAGIRVTKNAEEGRADGGVVGLGEILRRLKPLLHEDDHSYLTLALTDKWGLNLRNSICHALRPNFDISDFVVLAHIAARLRLFEPQPFASD